MRPEPDPAVLYPDVAAHGSLAVALQASAAEQGIPLVMRANPSDPLRHATAADVVAHRAAPYVTAWNFERKWSVWGLSRNRIVIYGETTDLHHLPKVVAGWAHGADLAEIAEAASFDALTGRFEVPDGNPADVIASEWQWMLEEARLADRPEYRALIEAAHAEARLRGLFPYTSHWALGFDAAPSPTSFPSFVSVGSPLKNDHCYTIRRSWDGPVLARVRTPEEAASIAVTRNPADFPQPTADTTTEGC